MWVEVRARPIESLMLRGPGEFHVGAGSWLSPLPLPLPTTVCGAAGAIGWVISGRRSLTYPSRWERLLDNLARFLGVERVEAVRGPYLVTEQGVWISAWNGVVRFDPRELRKRILDFSAGKWEKKGEDELFVPVLKFSSRRIGISLQRGGKTVRRGFIYSAPYVDYMSVWREPAICVDVKVSGAGERFEQRRSVCRLGGEGRKAIVESRNRSTLRDLLWKAWSGRKGGRAAAILLSPMILEGQPRNPESLIDEAIRVVESIDSIDSVEGILPVHRGGRVTISVLQLGYDEVARRRAGFQAVVLPGAAFVCEVRDWESVYGFSGIPQERVGFGSLAPIPL